MFQLHRLQRRPRPRQRLAQHPAIQRLRRLHIHQPQQRRHHVNVTRRQRIHHARPEIRPRRRAGVVQIRGTQRHVHPAARRIFMIAIVEHFNVRMLVRGREPLPARGHNHIRRRRPAHMNLGQRERARQTRLRENHARKCLLLQRRHHLRRHRGRLPHHVKHHRPAIAHHHHIAVLRRLFPGGFGIQTGGPETFANITIRANRRKPVIRNHDDIRLVAHSAPVQLVQHRRQPVIAIANRRQGLRRTRSVGMLRKIRLAQPQHRIARQLPARPERLRQAPRRPLIPPHVRRRRLRKHPQQIRQPRQP